MGAMMANGDGGTTSLASGGKNVARLIERLPFWFLSEMPPGATVWRRRMYRRRAKSSASVYTMRLATASTKIENPAARALATDNAIHPASNPHTASGARTGHVRRVFTQ